MVQRISLADDIDGSTEDIATVTFALGRDTYEVDLNPTHQVALREALAPFIRAGRTVRPPTGSTTKTRSRVPNQTAPVIRSWARANGYNVPPRGRLPGDIVAAWEAAHAPA